MVMSFLGRLLSFKLRLPASLSFSMYCFNCFHRRALFPPFSKTISAHAASPVILTVVLPISNILSIPATRAIPSIGRLTLLKHHGQHNHSCSRHPSCSDRCQRGCQDNCNLLSQSQVNAVTGCYKDCTDALINGGTVHIDCSSERQDEACHFFLSAHLSTHSRLRGRVPTEEALEKP